MDPEEIVELTESMDEFRESDVVESTNIRQLASRFRAAKRHDTLEGVRKRLGRFDEGKKHEWEE